MLFLNISCSLFLAARIAIAVTNSVKLGKEKMFQMGCANDCFFDGLVCLEQNARIVGAGNYFLQLFAFSVENVGEACFHEGNRLQNVGASITRGARRVWIAVIVAAWAARAAAARVEYATGIARHNRLIARNFSAIFQAAIGVVFTTKAKAVVVASFEAGIENKGVAALLRRQKLETKRTAITRSARQNSLHGAALGHTKIAQAVAAFVENADMLLCFFHVHTNVIGRANNAAHARTARTGNHFRVASGAAFLNFHHEFGSANC